MPPITVDATRLTLNLFSILGVTQRDSGSLQTIDLAPGSYRFGTLFGPTFEFEVRSDGQLHVEPSLGFVSTPDPTTLQVTGFEITVDASQLTLNLCNVNDSASGLGEYFPTNVLQRLRLIPGPYVFGTLYGPTFRFNVDSAGNVAYDTELTFLGPPGTSTLTVLGFDVTIDATQLTLDLFNLNDSRSGLGEYFPTNVSQRVRLIPGPYIFGTLYGPTFRFDINSAGNVTYDAALTFLGEAGSSTLTVRGFELTIDATQLTLDLFNLNDSGSGLGEHFATNVPQRVRLIPGPYVFGTLYGPTFRFDVDRDGHVAYDASITFLDPPGGSTLTVRGFEVTIDATQLTLDLFNLNDSASGLGEYFRTNAPQRVRLIPGRYVFGTLYGPTFRFDVDAAGNIGYESALTFLGPAGTPTLEVLGFLVSVDATRVAAPTFNINDSGSGLGESFAADSAHCMSLIPGAYVFQSGFSLPFAVTSAGQFDYATGPTIDACVSGRGTQRLRISCAP